LVVGRVCTLRLMKVSMMCATRRMRDATSIELAKKKSTD